jgi:hypothetical protein
MLIAIYTICYLYDLDSIQPLTVGNELMAWADSLSQNTRKTGVKITDRECSDFPINGASGATNRLIHPKPS